MRDKIKDSTYYTKQISVFQDSILEIENMIATGKTSFDRVNFMRRITVGDSLNVITSLYSAGCRIHELSNHILKAIKSTNNSWDGFWLIKTGNPTGAIVLKQYGIDAYDQMLWMLSLGYLLNIADEDFKKLVEVIDRDGVKDFLFEFIIRAKLKDREPITEESYQEFFGVPQTFEKLRQAITETDKSKAEKLVKEFITKDWYKNHKDAGWYNSHKSKHDTYFGYWSFETAAVVTIMGLDDSSFKDCQYYPKDLVHNEAV
jgi:hypothetical protein